MEALGSPSSKQRALSRRGRDRVEGPSSFYAMFTGQVESATFPNLDSLYVRYTFQHGPDWKIAQGIDAGFSQEAQKGGAGDASIVWNFPIDVTFKSTNPFGWPRLVLSVYSKDFLGRYVIRGYGSVLLPTTPGRYVRHVRTFAPASSTMLQAAIAWLTGALPEFYDSRFAASGKGREVVRTVSTGVVRVAFNVVTRGMAAHGYLNGAPPDMPDLDAESAAVAAAAHGGKAPHHAEGGGGGGALAAAAAASSRRTLGAALSASSAVSSTVGGGAGAFAAVSAAAAAAPAGGSGGGGGGGGESARERRAGGEEAGGSRRRHETGERRRSSSRSRQPGEQQPRGGVVAVDDLAGGGKSDA